MRVAVASGKGGTGKTTVSASLAVVRAERGASAYVDCDVEEPNGHIFLKPDVDSTDPVTVAVPEIDSSACTRCGACARFCRYNALACLPDGVLVFDELCHGCGGCSLVCPAGAIAERPRPVGVIESGSAGGVRYLGGRLAVGEVMAPPVVRALKARLPEDGLVVLDAPPGTSCLMVESVRGADFALLVTEPTPFGLNDLELAVETVRVLGLPFGVVINRCDVGDDRVRRYCADEGIELLLEIPNDRAVAEAYAVGTLPVEVLPEFRARMEALADAVIARAGGVAEKAGDARSPERRERS